MGIAKISGELGDTPLAIHENDKVIGVEKVPGDMLNILQTQPHIYNTTHNTTSLSLDLEAPIVNALKAFISGTGIKVEWFHQMASGADDNSNFSTVSFLSDSVTCSYLQIVNMEINLLGPMTFAYDDENNISSLTGSAVLYPGFIPNIGDMFIYRIDTGALGLFKVSETPERLSISTLTSHSIKFTLIKMLTEDDRSKLLERVRDTSYFNKQRFLSESSALLTHQEVVDLDHITKTIKKLTNHYGTLFYDSACNSIFRPDGMYDPFMIEFLLKTVGIYFNGKYMIQLYPHVDNTEMWFASLYSKLIDRDNIADMVNTATITKVTYGAYSGIVNALINKNVIMLDRDGEETYLESNILSIDTDNYTAFDKVVSLLLSYGVVSYAVLKNLADTIRSSDKATQFYQIPIIIYILKLVKDSIQTGKSIQYVVEDVPPYINISFTDDMLVNKVLTVEVNGGKAVGVVTNTGDTLFLITEDFVYQDSKIIIDFTRLFESISITEITGTWKLVVTNTILN